MSLLALVLLFMTPIWILAAHAILARTPWGARQPRQLATIQCAFAVALLLSFAVGTNAQSLIFALTLSLGLGHVYFHVFNMSETARRIRILVALEKGVGHSALEATYNSDDILQVRLERLLSMGQVIESKGVYRAPPSLMLRVSRVMKAFERLLFPSRG